MNKLFELRIGYLKAIYVKAVDLHPANRFLFGIKMIGTHQKVSSGDQDHFISKNVG